MEVLIIEDDGFKQDAIERLLRNHLNELIITVEKSVQTAVKMTTARQFDLIVLDIALPSHDREKGAGNPRSMPSGGVEVLLNLNRMGRQDPVLILTQYPEVEIWGELVALRHVIPRLTSVLNVHIVGLVHFDQTSTKWHDFVISAIGGIK